MFIAGSYMLYSSPPNISTSTSVATPPYVAPISVFAGRTSTDSKKLVSGFSVSDILESRARMSGEDDDDDDDDEDEDEDDEDDDDDSDRSDRRHVMTMTMQMQRPKVAACVVVARAESPKSGSSLSPSPPPPPSIVDKRPSLSSGGHRVMAVVQQNLITNRDTLATSPIKSPKMLTPPPIPSSQLKFGVDRILAKDDVIPNRKDFSSSCTVCVSPFTPQPPLPPAAAQLPNLPLPLRSRGVPCECMHPLCDGTGLFPTVYAYNSAMPSALMYPACTLYPSAHHLSSNVNDVMLSGGRMTGPNFVYPRPMQHLSQQHFNTHHHHPQVTGPYMHSSFSTAAIGNNSHNHHHHLHHQGSGPTSAASGSKRKRSWSRAVFSNLQRKGLEKRFQIQKYITKPDRRQLAATLGLTDAQVKVWFQNRRMKWRHSKEAKEEFARNNTNNGTGTNTGTSKNDEQQNNNKHVNTKEAQKSSHATIINKQDVCGSKMAAK